MRNYLKTFKAAAYQAEAVLGSVRFAICVRNPYSQNTLLHSGLEKGLRRMWFCNHSPPGT